MFNMKITWYGTATIGIDDGKTRLIFDPFVRMNKRIETTPVEGFAGFDAVLVTHGHFDHIYSIPALAEVDKKVPINAVNMGDFRVFHIFHTPYYYFTYQ